MAKNPKSSFHSKKHLARLERERIQTRYIMIAGIVIISIVVLLVGYSALDQLWLRNIRPVATVNGQKIETKDWQAMVRYSRLRTIETAAQFVQQAELFVQQNPAYAGLYASQLQQLQSEMQNETIGQNALDQLIQGILIKQEAEKRGLSISDEELVSGMQSVFGFYAEGTPTATATWIDKPTSTLSPLQKTLVPPTATVTPSTEPINTPTETSAPTPTTIITEVVDVLPSPTLGPTSTPTPYTLAAYETQYAGFIQQYQENIQFSETDLRNLLRTQLLVEKLRPVVLDELKVTREQEMVWARHILVADEDTANGIIGKLEDGDDWSKLALENSQDPGSNMNGGDLGWFSPSTMVKEFSDAAFALKIGEISNPIQTEHGWHIIQALGHEVRSLSPGELSQLESSKYQEWLAQVKESADIQIDDTWKSRLPTTPEFPQELLAAIKNLLDLASQPIAPATDVPQ